MLRYALALALGFCIVAVSQVAVTAQDKKGETKTLEGKLVCTKCKLAETDACGNALLVKEGMIISDGYNGTPTGFPNDCEDAQGLTHWYVLHAEANAIMKVARSTNNAKGATLYLTHSPCKECSKLILQAGIERLVYLDAYKDPSGLDLLTSGKVVVRSRVLSNSIQLVIADTGIGIAPQSLTRLGRPFEQVESQLTKTYHGSGLGLAIARSLTKLHGGSMRMRSKLGAGTVVCVSLPRDPRKGAAKISVAA